MKSPSEEWVLESVDQESPEPRVSEVVMVSGCTVATMTGESVLTSIGVSMSEEKDSESVV